MNFQGNFRNIGNVDVADIRRIAAGFTEEQWAAEAFRQRRYEVHRDTQTIALVFDEDFRHSHPTRLPELDRLEQALRPTLQLVAEHFEDSDEGHRLLEQHGYGYFVRATLVRLVAGGSIDAHTDNNFSLAHSHRVHVPVDTNDGVVFTIGKETRALKEGEVVEINNRRMHSVVNGGTATRVHLILDFVIPGEKCCCGKIRHPDSLCTQSACEPTDHLEILCECFPEA